MNVVVYASSTKQPREMQMSIVIRRYSDLDRSRCDLQGWVPMNDMGGNKDFLSKHKGWYLNNKVNRKSRSDMDSFKKLLREAAGKGKGT